MVATAQNDTFYAGNVRTFTVTVTDEDQSGSPPLDLTGLVVKWGLSRYNTATQQFSATTLVEKCSNNGTLTISDPTQGEVTFTLDPADTSSLSGQYYHELEVFDAQNRGVVVTTGIITILRNLVQTC